MEQPLGLLAQAAVGELAGVGIELEHAVDGDPSSQGAVEEADADPALGRRLRKLLRRRLGPGAQADQSRHLGFPDEQVPMFRFGNDAEPGEWLPAALHEEHFILDLLPFLAGDVLAVPDGGDVGPQRSGALGQARDRGGDEEDDEQQGAADGQDQLVVLAEKLEHGESIG